MRLLEEVISSPFLSSQFLIEYTIFCKENKARQSGIFIIKERGRKTMVCEKIIRHRP